MLRLCPGRRANRPWWPAYLILAALPGVKDLEPRLERTLQSARAGLKDFTTERKGTTVLGSLRIKTDEPVTAFVLLLSMAPRPAKQ